MKNRFLHIALFGLTILFLASCEKPETPYKLPPRPDNPPRMLQVDLGNNYEQQTFINLIDSNFIKGVLNINEWDLSFDCKPDAHRVLMNDGKGVLIATVESHEFVHNLKPRDVKFKWDAASGGDSVVINNWFDPKVYGKVIYVIDRGVAAAANGNRYFQFRFVKGYLNAFNIEVASMNGEVIKRLEIVKDPTKNKIYFTFDHMGVLNFEPNNTDWHFCFLPTRWIYYEYNPPLLYIVTGIHINPNLVTVATDSTMQYESIKKADVVGMNYEDRRDVMGFEWKIYDFTLGRYHSRKYVNYIFKIKGASPVYYKVRFVDFYSKQGVKGVPRFEVSEIK